MCGRYTLSAATADLIERIHLLHQRWNITQQSRILVIRQKPDEGRVSQLTDAQRLCSLTRRVTSAAGAVACREVAAEYPSSGDC